MKQNNKNVIYLLAYCSLEVIVADISITFIQYGSYILGKTTKCLNVLK